MQTTWTIVADSSRARIFEMQEGQPHLREIADLVNPAGRADDDDLRTDERGRFYGKGERHQAHTADPAVLSNIKTNSFPAPLRTISTTAATSIATASCT